MEKFSVIILITILHLVIFVASEQTVPTDNITLNCGAPTDLYASDGRFWGGDNNSKFGPFESSSHNKSKTYGADNQGGSVETVPHMTARVSGSEFNYTFHVTPGQKFVRLYFHPASYGEYDKSKAFFTVRAGSFTLLRNFSAFLVAESLNVRTLLREFCLNVGDNEVLNLVFTPSPSASNDTYAFINGVEIVSMPTNLYYRPPDQLSSGVPFVGQRYEVTIENDTALEKAYRLNVGGETISPTEDTGLFRLWSDDSDKMTTDSYFTINTTVPINYTIPRYTAPEKVYRTARSMGPNRTYNERHNLSWRLPVDSGFRYMVRLHFCEVQDPVNLIADRMFEIFINNQIAEAHADVILWTGGYGKVPIYKDYIVLASRVGNKNRQNMTIDLHPIVAFYVDVILNGIEVFKLSNSDGNLGGVNPELLVAPPRSTSSDSSNSRGGRSKKGSLLIAGVGCALGLITLLSLLACTVAWRQRKGKNWLFWSMNQKEAKSTMTSSLPDELCCHFSLDEMKAATNNFHDDLVVGQGGFGKVYKGFMDAGERIVAIKRLNPESRQGVRAIKRLNPESTQGVREFMTEIEMLTPLRHAHLVSLIGYCNENGEMILVYDFMRNGTLSDHLYGTSFASDPLTWKQRLEICKGAASGLNYLHTEVKHTIIHRDVKTSNILLDDKFTAKVSDFGLSKTDPKVDTLITGIKGTRGYLDPEYARGHTLTEKSDVYAFGVVLFEVLCARKALDTKLAGDKMNLAHWAKNCIEDGTLYRVIDPNLIGKIAPECFKVFVEIAESCIAEVGINRPTMKDVMEKLGFAIELQEAADVEKSRIDPESECSYPDIVFPVARDMDFDGESFGDTEFDTRVYSGVGILDSDAIGLTYPTIDSSTSLYPFSSTTTQEAPETRRKIGAY
ncbi:putative Malectin/receptor-like protein kinase family protein [Hibiscus syriacus]|uniref:Malectin/receptor-like protein kinase family protein n=1 Tax=Hibiscus syriacus TaxID=106335 RepID=A0A6A2ZDM9_HIBSY|nr:receptor-like protein kinase FERONIA [Hibiscus syriacus]KAE8690121.1 putative Malectin/receptor-like protein kinase family protein [Hibiscus syriacus]